MAGTLTAAKQLNTLMTKTENQDVLGKNWATEIWLLTASSDNDATTKAITSLLTRPIFVTITPTSDENVTTYLSSISGSTVTVGFHAAPTTATYLVKIEGWA